MIYLIAAIILIGLVFVSFAYLPLPLAVIASIFLLTR
jgi:hypothetical protein